ncbi:TIGR04149 family rSAM-modified RiPP [Flavobacterium hibisci]|uniref:TIGR04149 family rSAM-modified RiPP n=1 Tax=Flavobacterium hibisci TaxID=1914462 RepID=UPI001CBD489E|nr:TIGR04149 family rSAM-modified RiPP [Flavobacterium hibisci]MBZ4042603.1 TIGR04149 family rSAM-modified RiPP [Flavobacterium hibisci]
MKKLSLKTAKNVLSRKEMKAISGGYGQDINQCWLWCKSAGGWCEYYYGEYKCRVG